MLPITSFAVVPTYIENNTIENLCRKVDCHRQLNEYYKKYYYVKQFHKALAVSYYKSGNRYVIDNFGMSWQYNNPSEAKSGAFNSCNKHSNNCEVLLVNNAVHNKELYELFTQTTSSSYSYSSNIPANAYKAGNAWFCKTGYKKTGNKCISVNVPKNAYASGNSFKCISGYTKSGNSCIKKISIPANAYASSSATKGWKCKSGYYQNNNYCSKLPSNAIAKTYGDGWKCKSGYYQNNNYCSKLPSNALAYGSGDGFFCKSSYKKSGNSCIKKISIPANAYASSSATKGWKCKSGYYQNNNYCSKLPSNAIAKTYGDGWQCKSGYKKSGNSCIKKVKIPANAYASDTSTGWKCKTGYRKNGSFCELSVPTNAYAVGSSWKCKFGYTKSGNRCIKKNIPANAYASNSSSDGWKCFSAFTRSGNYCVKVPKNAYAYGSSWKCKSGYKRVGAGCEKELSEIYIDGNKYVGELRNGKPNGRGTITYTGDGSKYVGEWKNGKRYGRGKMAYTNGTTKEGVWKDDEFLYATNYSITVPPSTPSAETKANIAKQLAEELQQKIDQLEAERAAQKEAFEQEQYQRLLTEEIQADQDLERQHKIEDQLNTLKSAYVNHIAARVRSYWRHQGADDDWGCDVYIQQSVEGVVEAVNVQNCTLDDSDKARSFKNSIERAVYKASPLPIAPDESVFDKEILFRFRVN